MTIHYHPQFRISYKNLPVQIKKKAEKKEVIFKNNPHDPRLKTHKLHGKLKKLWGFSIDKNYRIIFEFLGKDIVFLDIGTHSLYK
ncbi:MAG: hypothetical protein A3B86_04060 [Candidatus Yanofskybacteria bacterium RIFCSPHIGHO2_02_FULL_38_22b]|uniref:Toxin YoeB n=1 Tax=Candidatus Yanofskybacteria bacterium RIFCSPHIGHO2_02_FULL_38_22b TaxID=1802673 RepID=A0A1F8F204_9BACT|nr:MAG: hypothetical protein A2816_01830 [Candidatus Yanofskybacteria bacterium RIFCSPHIGHO2_01_FULL_39_44]OGN06266.1 MAG: hypothetical protein A3B86_04060 [Candidatus Yanofskybacteria bacterium RIFCSPHIGHO2_02_FULL_38_22b]OGN19686.1 MAG: hypothetical protein A2910_03795 [Candidatus Yanofskybacteria bacterium RIFCSPLOWO2_01_FULL_39_28]